MLRTGFRFGLGAAIGLLWGVSIWLCLVAGIVILLRPALGLGGALLSVGGALFAMALVALTVLIPSFGAQSAPQSVAWKKAVEGAFFVLLSRNGGRLALGAIGAALLSLALVLPGPRDGPPS
ncbi:hypothetical protein MACH21_26760 [Roseicyclus marinus]|uniref:Uncharacterized protein n=1 Tax=Roseicyclus marinus TaxID=2161673 RepID=A0AA48HJ08_9RHOB|nr:hypothetical protein MACH21_26760 [Roseicyclus marinus]